jgi:hypothetical protein
LTTNRICSKVGFVRLSEQYRDTAVAGPIPIWTALNTVRL